MNTALRLAVALVFAALLSARAADPAPAPAAAIRIVNCGDHVQSKKRGVCENHMSAEDFRALAPGVSWYYNWSVTTGDLPPDGVHMDFYPQAWGHPGDGGEIASLKAWLAAHKTKVVLALNEPNLRGQSFMPPQAAADYYKQIVAAAGGIPVVGPNMSLGSATGDSITAMDPVQNKQVTYTFMTPYLKAFYYYTGTAPVAGTALHTYGNLGELQWATGEMHKQFQKPVWITEFADWHAASPAESLKYLVSAVDFFERTPYVAGYAFFKERATNNHTNISLLEAAPGQLSPLGKAYVAMPVHDADIYYRLPGRLSAGSYVNAINSDLELTDDKDSANGTAFDMTSTGPAQLYYNIQVDKAGSYKLKFRVSDSGKPIEILNGNPASSGTMPGQANGATGQQPSLGATPRTVEGWQTVEATVTLPAGPQTLHISTGGQTVEWIEFSQP